jgi:hypothetical protein
MYKAAYFSQNIGKGGVSMHQSGIHETMEAMELLNTACLSLTKSSGMRFMAKDEGLKHLLQVQADADKRHIHMLQRFLNQEKQHG